MKSILVVEGYTVIIELIRFLLTTFGYEIKGARDGFEALKIAKENRFDLILLDLQLPGFDGLQILKEIKRLPELDRTPVIALIAHSMQGDKDRFLKAGCSGYISKLIDIDRFKSMLDSCMGGHQSI
ncbi:MAG: two-component system, cell cycle response regulator DivK [Euryarchaeota archaeon]|nr:two-component system, cell cycle response regulator DivK [Euryarchaeota archaeon]